MSTRPPSPTTKSDLARRFIRAEMRSVGLGGTLPSIATFVKEINDRLARKPVGNIHSISAIVVRMALDELTRDGLLDTGRGRPARVISTVDLETRGLGQSTRELSVAMKVIDLRPPEVIPVGQDPISEHAGQQLGLGSRDYLLRIDRLREIVDCDRPGSLRWDRTFLPASLQVQIRLEDFGVEDSLYQVEHLVGLRPKSREVTVAARELTPSECQRFLFAAPMPVLAIEQITIGYATDNPQDLIRYEFLYALCGSAWKLTYHRQ